MNEITCKWKGPFGTIDMKLPGDPTLIVTLLETILSVNMNGKDGPVSVDDSATRTAQRQQEYEMLCGAWINEDVSEEDRHALLHNYIMDH